MFDLSGKTALVTGATGGIGGDIARALHAQGAKVAISGTRRDVLNALAAELGGAPVLPCDLANKEQVETLVPDAEKALGQLDILVANAGIASAAPIEETSLDLWRRNHDVLAEGYFLSAREAFPLLKAFGGAIVFVGSKNALAASINASAYASAKAAALHLARCLALEGAPHGIRVNVVNPDAVIRGSRIWDGDWRRERADAYGIDPGEALEAHYRDRSLLKRDVLPEDVAEAVAFFASDRASKSTGNILNVDAGNAQAFTR